MAMTMPYDSPVSNESHNSVYSIGFHHQAFINTPFQLTFGEIHDDSDDAERDGMAQEFVDLIDGSVDFTLDYAVKTYPVNETLTPTP